jgi:hypothetical protein
MSNFKIDLEAKKYIERYDFEHQHKKESEEILNLLTWVVNCNDTCTGYRSSALDSIYRSRLIYKKECFFRIFNNKSTPFGYRNSAVDSLLTMNNNYSYVDSLTKIVTVDFDHYAKDEAYSKIWYLDDTLNSKWTSEKRKSGHLVKKTINIGHETKTYYAFDTADAFVKIVLSDETYYNHKERSIKALKNNDYFFELLELKQKMNLKSGTLYDKVCESVEKMR